ncbi:MAG: CbiX/SirB N-terminal domain-containing protein [Gemmatimonadetes bacterium]|nr:CbiX/SirB N-terminal domain-containing protein [Gemmatimonadota bacterium]
MHVRTLIPALALSATLVACGGNPSPRLVAAPEVGEIEVGRGAPAERLELGVLVMAHGGSETWNETVAAAVRPLADEVPTSVAFGMADPVTLQAAVDELEDRGVTGIAVVRLFVSGESFLHMTEYLFRQRADAPSRYMGRSTEGLEPLDLGSRVVIDPQGLVEAEEAGSILRDRALALSTDPSAEAVLVLGHGNGDETINARLLAHMDARAEVVRSAGFREVRVETLREDWAEARAKAEARVRRWVTTRHEAGTKVLVVPLRLSGFGPYADVLEGLEYEANGLGLLPNEAITSWLRRRARHVACEHGWSARALPCRTVTEDHQPSRRR